MTAPLKSSAGLVIGEAIAEDIPALAQLHVTTWNATYAPMLMNGPPVAVREHSEYRGEWNKIYLRRLAEQSSIEKGE